MIKVYQVIYEHAYQNVIAGSTEERNIEIVDEFSTIKGAKEFIEDNKDDFNYVLVVVEVTISKVA
jgi:hypothetical protein